MNSPTFITLSSPSSNNANQGDTSLSHIKYIPIVTSTSSPSPNTTFAFTNGRMSSNNSSSGGTSFSRTIAYAFLGLVLFAVLTSMSNSRVLCDFTPAIADAVTTAAAITELPSACPPTSCNMAHHNPVATDIATAMPTVDAVATDPVVDAVRVVDVMSIEPPSACRSPQSCNTTQLFRSIRHGYRDAFDTLPFHTACHVHTFTADEACDLLQRHGPLVLHGDSLMRHLTQAVLIILANDFQNATDIFTNEEDDDDYVSCQGDNAFDDGHASHPGEPKNTTNLSPKRKYCRSHSIAGDVKRARELLNYCPKWGQHMIFYTQNWIPKTTDGIIVMSGGLHYPKLDDEALNKTFDVEVPSSWTKICALLHAPGKGKPAKFLTSHGVVATRAYNEAILTNVCQEPGDLHFDAFSPTNNARSVDGQHYFQETNVLLAQLLFNTIKAKFENDEDI